LIYAHSKFSTLSRSYYSVDVTKFLEEPTITILGELEKNHQVDMEWLQQRNAWIKEIDILKKQLRGFYSGYILFEYSIPRMGKRADVVLILNGLIFVIEFKINENQYRKNDIDQCFDYVLDLKYFHEQSHNAKIIPVLLATDAVDFSNIFEQFLDGVFKPIKCNKNNLNETILKLSQQFGGNQLDPIKWENSIYKPTPTIIEAAQALYEGHSVEEISRSDSAAENLTKTTDAINKIIEKSKRDKIKSICFVTGVPGSGKTLAGLNLANKLHKFSEQEHAVFLSGNGPLVEVLQEALARNKVQNSSDVRKTTALRESKAFIQNIHHFRDDAIGYANPVTEKVVVFDEAQRAWNLQQTSSFMEKRGHDFTQSEPEFLISVMDRHKDWCVIVCLIGGGQEINKGEAGLLEWFCAIEKQFNHWQVYVSNEISDTEYTRGVNLQDLFTGMSHHEYVSDLHLKTSIRSFRSENVAKLVKAILDCDKDRATKLYLELEQKYPIVITRNITKAKEWLKQKARANERFGIVASSKALRLKPYGIFVELKVDPKNWFLNLKDDVRSSYFLEYVATEFDIQGLELDWVCVGWDADFRFLNQGWDYYQFRGKDWQKIRDVDSMLYLRNTYRVLLTRARQGLIIFIPRGEESDPTRIPPFYDETYEYLKGIGLKEII
jgi:hypothetical protein